MTGVMESTSDSLSHSQGPLLRVACPSSNTSTLSESRQEAGRGLYSATQDGDGPAEPDVPGWLARPTTLDTVEFFSWQARPTNLGTGGVSKALSALGDVILAVLPLLFIRLC